MLECVTSFTLAEHFFGHVYDPPTGPWGYTRVANPERKPFPTKDGYIGLLPYTDAQWDQFFAAAGLARDLRQGPALRRLQDPRPARPRTLRAGGGGHAVADHRRMAGAAQAAADSGRAKMNRLEDLQGDPHLQAVGLFERYEHPRPGPTSAPPAGEVRRDPGQHPPPPAPPGRAHRRTPRRAGDRRLMRAATISPRARVLSTNGVTGSEERGGPRSKMDR